MKLKEGTEEFKAEVAKWKEQAGKMTLDELPAFLRHLMSDYEHDYGTICHAFSMGAVATCWAMDREPQGGLTGFQASAIMWGFVQHWLGKTGPMRMLDYSLMLYPQHDEDFDRAITKSTWEWLKAEAQKNLDMKEAAHPRVMAHWKRIIEGKVPFGFVVKG